MTKTSKTPFNVGDKVILPNSMHTGKVDEGTFVGMQSGKCKVRVWDFSGRKETPLPGGGTSISGIKEVTVLIDPADLKPVPMTVLPLKVADLNDWDLILVTNWSGLENDLPPKVQNAVMNAAWHHQDGYGEPGYTPPQGEDWSGIRDSSPEGKRNMANAIRQILLGIVRIDTITVSYNPKYVKWEPGKED